MIAPDVGNQLTLGAVTVFVIQALKKAKWFPWLTAETKKLNRILSVALAGAGAVGIAYSYNPTTHVLVISGLSLAAIGAAAWAWLKQFALQEILYRSAVKGNGTANVPQLVRIGQKEP